MVLDATAHCHAPVSPERLFGWHAALFPTGYSGLSRIKVGGWRDDTRGPMQVVSGPIGRQRVHFEAPPADRLDVETSRFLGWLNATSDEPPLLKAGLGHLWFVTLHPFDDGNGRIARAIGDLLLARAEASHPCPKTGTPSSWLLAQPCVSTAKAKICPKKRLPTHAESIAATWAALSGESATLRSSMSRKSWRRWSFSRPSFSNRWTNPQRPRARHSVT
jgi:hypothetical protein